mmetsp:Transcript_13754/g.31167  ORF Transcript_13754/g.31167 Transcript_13754/m.31167 type:complete len:187 (+) Transcript_13754:90-650(+)
MMANGPSTAGNGRRKRRRSPPRERGAANGPVAGGSIIKEGLSGTIRMFNADKGWGFIDSDSDGKDIFLHAKHFVGTVPSFWIGHKMSTKDKEKAPRSTTGPVRVTFDLSTSGDGKPQAVNAIVHFSEPMGRSDEDDAEDGSDVDDNGDVELRLVTSPTCSNCGSTIATRLGFVYCPLCRCLPWTPR